MGEVLKPGSSLPASINHCQEKERTANKTASSSRGWSALRGYMRDGMLRRQEEKTSKPHPPLSGELHAVLMHELPGWAVQEAAYLLNSEWPRSHAARVQSIQRSGRGGDVLPISILLLANRGEEEDREEGGEEGGAHSAALVSLDEEGCGDDGCPCCAHRKGRSSDVPARKPCLECDCFLCNERCCALIPPFLTLDLHSNLYRSIPCISCHPTTSHDDKNATSSYKLSTSFPPRAMNLVYPVRRELAGACWAMHGYIGVSPPYR